MSSRPARRRLSVAALTCAGLTLSAGALAAGTPGAVAAPTAPSADPVADCAEPFPVAEVAKGDLVDGLIALMESPDAVTGPVNLGNPGEFTIRQLAETVVEMTGSRSRVVSRELPQDDPKRRQPDIGLANEKLGWAPEVELAEGLERTIAYFRELLPELKVTN